MQMLISYALESWSSPTRRDPTGLILKSARVHPKIVDATDFVSVTLLTNLVRRLPARQFALLHS